MKSATSQTKPPHHHTIHHTSISQAKPSPLTSHTQTGLGWLMVTAKVTYKHQPSRSTIQASIKPSPPNHHTSNNKASTQPSQAKPPHLAHPDGAGVADGDGEGHVRPSAAAAQDVLAVQIAEAPADGLADAALVEEGEVSCASCCRCRCVNGGSGVVLVVLCCVWVVLCCVVLCCVVLCTLVLL